MTPPAPGRVGKKTRERVGFLSSYIHCYLVWFWDFDAYTYELYYWTRQFIIS